MVDSDLKFHLHILNTAQKAGGLAQNILRTTVCRSPEFMLPIFCSHIRPILEYCSCLWHTGYIGDLRALESVQRRWTKRIDGMSELDYGTRLRTLNLYSVSGRLLRADMILCWKIFHGKCCISPIDVFIISRHDRTRGHKFTKPCTYPDRCPKASVWSAMCESVELSPWSNSICKRTEDFQTFTGWGFRRQTLWIPSLSNTDYMEYTSRT